MKRKGHLGHIDVVDDGALRRLIEGDRLPAAFYGDGKFFSRCRSAGQQQEQGEYAYVHVSLWFIKRNGELQKYAAFSR
ncbi:hypothetical protein SL267_12530 [Serratia marcescens]|nr:hypothetical protein SL267_12530 [Serratia marcescens]